MLSLNAPASSVFLTLLYTDNADCWLRNKCVVHLIISQFEQVVTQWNAILFQLFNGWYIYRPVFISKYQTQMKLEPPSGVCQRRISISVYILGKVWHHSAASYHLYLFVCAMVCSLFIIFFQTIRL